MPLALTALEPRDAPRTWVDVRWEPGDGWTESAWIRGLVHAGINAVAGRVTNPAIPLVHVEVINTKFADDRLADGVNLGPVGAPYYGVMRFDFERILTEGWDVVGIVAHEYGHAGVGVAWHNPLPQDLMYPTARTAAQPWDGTLTHNDRLAFSVMGFSTD